VALTGGMAEPMLRCAELGWVQGGSSLGGSGPFFFAERTCYPNGLQTASRLYGLLPRNRLPPSIARSRELLACILFLPSKQCLVRSITGRALRRASTFACAAFHGSLLVAAA